MTEYNRRQTPDDFLAQTNEVRDERREVPETDILEEPLLCLQFNEDWFQHIIGAVNTLSNWTAWVGEDDDSNTGTRQIRKMLGQDFSCTPSEPCTIEELLIDDEFFYDEYVPATFGTDYSGALERNEDLATDYDGTPQSIGPEIPTGTPDDAEKNALCFALCRFVALYCSEKICLLQSRDFLEIAWTSLKDAAEAFYGNVLDGMVGAWGSELFGCIVDVPTALTVLTDTAAQEELACFLYDELSGVTITESAFTNAIDDAAGTLSGNAGLIACVMTEDMSQIVYLNFLEAYNTTLLRQTANEDIDCPCFSQSYKIWRHDFSDGMGRFQIQYSGSTALGTLSGGYIGSVSLTDIVMNGVDPSWRIKGMRMLYSRTSVGITSMAYRPYPYNDTSAVNPGISNGAISDGTLQWACQNRNTAPFYDTGYQQYRFRLTGSGGAGQFQRIHAIEVLYHDGFSDTGYPTADDNLCA